MIDQCPICHSKLKYHPKAIRAAFCNEEDHEFYLNFNPSWDVKMVFRENPRLEVFFNFESQHFDCDFFKEENNVRYELLSKHRPFSSFEEMMTEVFSIKSSFLFL